MGLRIVNAKSGAVVFEFGTLRGNNAPTRQAERIICKKCGAPIQGGKNASGVFRSPDEIALNTDGLCVKCYKAQQT